jgi:hypothetical protein
MGRVQIGKKEKVEIVNHKESTIAIARETLNSIVEEGFNGVDVLPDVWVLEKTLRNHIETSQPNIAPELSDEEIGDLSDSFLSSIKVKTDKSEERIQNQENYETKLDFPKDLPQINMGNVTVVQFPEGGSDASKSMKVDGYKKVGQFYRKKISSEMLGKRKGRTRKELDIIRKEKQDNLRRIKVRRGLLKPAPLKPISGGNTPFVPKKSKLPNAKPISPTVVPVQINPDVKKQVEIAKQKIQDGIVREIKRPLPSEKEIKLKRREARRRDKEFVKMLKKLNKEQPGRIPPGRVG